MGGVSNKVGRHAARAVNGRKSLVITIVVLLAAGGLLLASGAPPAEAQTSVDCQDSGPDAYGYTCSTMEGSFVDIRASGTPLALGDDTVSAPIDLRAQDTLPGFLFYGKERTTLRVSSNGFLHLSGSTTSGCCSGRSFPSTLLPNAIIAGYWTDLNPAAGGEVHYLLETDPARFTVQFTNVPHWAATGRLVTFQIVLDYQSSTPMVVYGPIAALGDASTGIEDFDGIAGLTYAHGSFNSPGDGLLNPGDGAYLRLPAGPAVTAPRDIRLVAPSGIGHPIGAQVVSGNADNGYGIAFPSTTLLCFTDDNTNGQLNADEPIYIAVDRSSCGSVRANDLRLAPTGSFSAGSFVQTTDSDFNDLLAPLASGATRLMYNDADGTGTYTLGDQVYMKTGSSGSSAALGDLRLVGASAFTRVTSGSSDLNRALSDFSTVTRATDPSVFGYYDSQKRAVLFVPPEPVLPSAPISFTATRTGLGQASLDWAVPRDNGMSHITGYRVYRGSSPTTLSAIADTDADSTAFADNSAPMSASYYAVTALNGVGEGPMSPARLVAAVPSGTVWAWGSNTLGSVGDGTSTQRDTPTETDAMSGSGFLTGVVQVDSNDFHNLALLADGGIAAWGANSAGQLGDGTTVQKHAPVRVHSPDGTGTFEDAVMVAAGRQHSLSLRSDGSVWSWGENSGGQLGDGTNTARVRPVQVVGAGGAGFLTDVISIGAGRDHSFAVRADGTAWAWGAATLGDGSTTPSNVPVQVAGPGGSGVLDDVIQLTGGGGISFALRGDGTVWAWGSNFEGRLGDGTTESRLTPVQVVGEDGVGFLTDITHISTTLAHTVAVRSDGTLWSWGTNEFGALGDGTTTDRMTPVQVVGEDGNGFLTGIVGADAAGFHTFALASDGTPWSWGEGSSGRLASGGTDPRTTPGRVVGPGGDGPFTDVLQVIGGRAHGAALRTVVPPGPVSDLTAAAGPGTGEITVSWSAPLDSGGALITAYNIYRDGTFIGSSSGTGSVVDAGRTAGVTHTYDVRAENEAGEGEPSTGASASAFDVPGAPLDLGAATGPGAGEISLVWEPPATNNGLALTAYNVYAGATSGDLVLIATVPASQTQFLHEGIENGATRFYQVSAVNDAGEGPRTGEVSAATFDVPSAPLAIAAAPVLLGPGEAGLELTWQAPADDGGCALVYYEVHAGPDAASLAFLTNTSASETSFVESVAPGETRFYSVRAVNCAGQGPFGDPSSATAYDFPGAPGGLTAATGATAGTIELAWEAPADDGGLPIDGYNIYGSTEGAESALIASLVPGPSYTHEGLSDGVTVSYEVRAVNGLGEGAGSVPASATTAAAPSAPLSIAAAPVLVAPGQAGINLTWQAPADDGGCNITAYFIYSGPDAESLAAHANVSGATFLFTDPVAPGETRHYSVRASNCVGEGAMGDPTQATAYDFPAPPLNLTAVTPAVAGTIELSWEPPADDGGLAVEGYAVYGGTDPANLSLVATLGAELAFTHDGLASGVTFHYEVSATNALGEGDRSAAASASTRAPAGPPQAAVGLAGPGVGQITIQWDAPLATDGLPVTGYRVYQGLTSGDLHLHATLPPEGGGGDGNLSALSGSLSYTESDLPNGTTRYFAVSAMTDAGEGEMSNEAHATTFASAGSPPPMPTGVSHTSAIWQGSYAYVFGGIDGAGNDTNSVVRFNPSTNEVVVLNATLPSPRHGTSSVWVPAIPPATMDNGGSDGGVGVQGCHGSCFEGDGLIFGGRPRNPIAVEGCHGSCLAGRQILIFSPEGETMTPAGAVFPEPRSATSAVFDPADRVAYVFGGLAEEHNETAVEGCHGSCRVGEEIWQYDPESDELTLHPVTFPEPRWGTSAVWDALEEQAYIFGGFHEASEEASVSSCDPGCMRGIWVFSPGSSTLEQLPVELPSDRWNTSAVWDPVGRSAYIFGGEGPSGPIGQVVRFDPDTLTVEVISSLPTDRSATSAVWTGTDAFVFGGDDGEQALDEIVQFTPSSPQDLHAQRTTMAGKMYLTWEEPLFQGSSPVSGYRVYRALENGSLAVVADVDGLSYLDTGLEIGVLYHYRVSALNAAGEGPQSNEVVIASATVPDAPRFLDAHPGPGPGQVRLQWYHPEDQGGLPIDVYRIYRGTDGGNLSLLATVAGTATEYADSVFSLSNPDPSVFGTVHYYRVAAVNALGEGAPSGLACSAPAPAPNTVLTPAPSCGTEQR